jgi:hypothetical protein
MFTLKKAAVLGVSASFALALAASPINNQVVTHFDSFRPAGWGGLFENILVRGSVDLSYSDDTGVTNVDLNVAGLRPNTTYSILIDGDGSGGAFPNAFTTNWFGRADWNFELLGPTADNAGVTIFRWDGDEETLFEVSNVEIRAVAQQRSCY